MCGTWKALATVRCFKSHTSGAILSWQLHKVPSLIYWGKIIM